MTTEEGFPGLYVHVPFCSAKCIHCGFFSLPAQRLIPDWLAALENEAGFYTDHFQPFDTLYLGGGTPSILSLDQLDQVLTLLHRDFDFHKRTETTLEMNPEDANPDKIRALLGLGVDRLNLGVQALEDKHLHLMGRRHSAIDSLLGIEAIREAGCENLGVDLIYGLPGQTVETWLKTLDRILEFAPEHLSCYQLTLEPATILERKVSAGEIVLPDEEKSRRLFLATSERLTRAGYVHYEVSNFARTGRHRSRHNTKYWRRVPYLGLGPSAHSYLGDRRWWNHSSLKVYRSDLKEGERPLAGQERLSPEDLFLESLCLGLRTDQGVDLALFRDRPDGQAKIREMAAQGLGVIRDNRFIPTPEGMVVADSLALALSDLPRA